MSRETKKEVLKKNVGVGYYHYYYWHSLNCGTCSGNIGRLYQLLWELERCGN